MREIKYTEEERKAAQKAASAKWRKNNPAYYAKWIKEHKAERGEYNAKYYQEHKDKKAEYDVEYRQANKEKIAKQRAEHYKQNRDMILAKNAEYYQRNRNEILAKQAAYNATPFGRARYLLKAYRQLDKNQNRGECTIDAQWIVDNVFSGQCCHYCGESDWLKLGVDRKDSSLPHTPENCVPCCEHCNQLKGTRPYDIYMRLIGKIA